MKVLNVQKLNSTDPIIYVTKTGRFRNVGFWAEGLQIVNNPLA